MIPMTDVSKLLFAAALFVALPQVGASAADYKVWMKGTGEQPMVFDPAFVKIAPGDTVIFMPRDAGHSVARVAGPAGTEPFEGEMDRQLKVTFSVEGLYAYKCPPHAETGMVGLIQVGDATTAADSAAAAELPAKAKSRMKALLAEAGVTP
jgi:pseudoazurin